MSAESRGVSRSLNPIANRSWWRDGRIDLTLLFIALACIAFLTFAPRPNTVEIDVESGVAGSIQLFFDQGAGFSEKLSSTTAYDRGRHTVEFAVPAGDSMRLRLDPSAGDGQIVLHRIEFADGTTRLSIPLSGLSAANQIASIAIESAAAKVSVPQDATDPQVVIALDSPIHAGTAARTARDVSWIALLICVILLAVRKVDFPSIPTPCFVVSGITLVVVMALLSPLAPSPHPDEFLHVADAAFFSNHWLPPSLRSGILASSYTNNVYGVSYLFEWNIVYWLAGKAGSLAGLIGVNPLLAYRAFNSILMALVAIAILWARLPKTALAVLFITPQLWYVFSYFNGDAFPFAMACVAVALVATPSGPLQSFVRSGGRMPIQGVLFAVVLGLLFVSKKNFLPAAVFASLWLCVSCLHLKASSAAGAVAAFAICVFFAAAGPALNAEFGMSWRLVAFILLSVGAVTGARWLIGQCIANPSGRAAILRFCCIHLIAVTVALPWIGVDLIRNGSGVAKSQLIADIREQNAAYPFKPSTIMNAPAQSQPGLQLAAKGIHLAATLRSPYDWTFGSARSFFSAYGYLKFFGPMWLYAGFGASLLTLVVLGAVSGVRSGSFAIRHLILIAGCSTIIVCAAALHSWTYDFQPQGRYLFAILPMLLPIFSSEPRSKPCRAAFRIALIVAFVLSTYSFLEIGLANLA